MSADVLSLTDRRTLSFAPGGAGGVAVDLERLVSSRLLVQADSGGGKSRLLRSMCEQLHGRVQIVVLDPEGEFATLREKYPFLLAGRDGDVAADPKTAKMLARRLMELSASAVVDLYDLKLQDRRRYLKLFLDEIMSLPRRLWRPCLFVIDEAHVYCPQGAEAESSDAVITLCTQGRKRGYCAVLATQRISKLHKDAAAELKNRLVGSTGLDLDMKRAGDDLGFDKEQRLALRQLEPGSFWAYGPAVSREPVLVRSGPVETTHPTPGAVAAPTPPPPAAVRKMLAQMQGLEREAEEEARTIEGLQKQLSAEKSKVRKLERGAPTAAPVIDEKAIARAVAAAEKQARSESEHTIRDLRAQLGDLTKRAGRAFKLIGQGGELVESIALLGTATMERSTQVRPVPTTAAGATTQPRRSPPAARNNTKPTEGLTPAQQRILNALATLESIGVDQPVKATLGAFSGYSNTSGGAFTNNLGRLSTAGMIFYPVSGAVSLTDDGRDAAEAAPEPPTLQDLHQKWIDLLPPARGRILAALIDAYPDELTKQELGERTGYSNTSGGAFTNNLGRLSTMGALTYPRPGVVRAADLLFPEGL